MGNKRQKEAYINGRQLRPESLMMGYGHHPEWSEWSVKMPIYQTSTFVFKNSKSGEKFFKNLKSSKKHGSGLVYSRINHPNLEVFEDRLTLWDDAEECAGFNSGMAAIASVLFGFLKSGDVILHSEPLYGGTEHLISELRKFGIGSMSFNHRDTEQDIAYHAKNKNIAMIFIETPANPTNTLIDIGMCSRIAEKLSQKNKKVLLCVDNTFLGPLWQHPLQHGADLVIYSATKYIGGHSDLIAGAVLGSKDLIETLKGFRIFMGTLADPGTCSQLCKSLETLKLRMTEQTKNAEEVADFLSDNVEKVYYPGHLTDDRQYEIYKKQCLASGAVISFDVKGGKKSAFRVLDNLKLIKLAVSLGGTESLAQHPASMTHSGLPKKKLDDMGITDGMIRLSVGVENPKDLILDLEQALKKA